ncbi:MAG TPA: hypothetical protein PKC21_04800 [Oligoflexia bacterium]|nr:hypothetical protein [Oligoflexia bacterium]HMR24656.1 hypothetical protein [Oligoflexia bacterium]
MSCSTLKSNPKSICDGRVVIDSSLLIDFSKNEKKILCGDSGVEAWSDLPLIQTEVTLKKILKNRSFFDVQTSISNNKLYVTTGQLHYIEKIMFHNAPEDFEKVRYIAWQDKTLTSENLDKVEVWVMRRLKFMGYACAKVELKAMVETKTLHVYIEPGIQYTFPQIIQDKKNNQYLKPGVLPRFYAFRTGDQFNGDLLELSSKRTENSGIINHSYFLTECQDNELQVTQKIKLGANRLFKVGAGASTEELPILKFGWKNSRVGKSGSSLFADLYASQINQNIRLGFEWHAFSANRWFMLPSIEARRIRDGQQKFLDLNTFFEFGAKLDSRNNTYSFKGGPGMIIENTEKGPFDGAKEFGILRSSLEISSNDFEIFLTEPRRGFQFNFISSLIFASNRKSVGTQHFKISGTRLWNVYNFGPPKYVFGLRFGLESVVSTQFNVRDFIPQHYFQWLGGDASIRGFSRREIPNNDLGALSSLYGGSEFRFVSLFANTIDPFIFLDLGMVGDRNFKLDPTVYGSPGLGLRYDSFIGTLRATVAHGFVFGNAENVEQHPQFFLSLGREF